MIKDELENLNDYASDITSGDGTNGILIEIFKRLDIDFGFCVEFGAADGVWNSNTNPFWSNGWEALLIESDPKVYQTLLENTKEFDKVSSLNCFVSPYLEEENPRKSKGFMSLDKILDTKVNCDKNFDLLSIDVDGNDFYIWKNLEKYNPKCVVVEYNQTIPPNIEFVDDIQEYLSAGASIKSSVKLGEEKGYSLVACTGSNLIFVNNDHVLKLGDITTDIKDLYDLSYLTCIVSTQQQDKVYITKKRPPNYYMTFNKYTKELQVNFPKDEQKLEPFKGLYPAQLYYEFGNRTSLRILDGHILFPIDLDHHTTGLYLYPIEEMKKDAVLKGGMRFDPDEGQSK